MKKFFTLIAAVAMAASVNAQGVFAVKSVSSAASGGKITAVENITMTWGNTTWTISAVDGKSNFEGYEDFTNKATPKDNLSYDSEVKTVPVKGGYVVFEPAKDGSVTAAYKLNKAGSSSKFQYFVDEEGNNVIDPIENATSESKYLATTFPVKAGKKYYTLKFRK